MTFPTAEYTLIAKRIARAIEQPSVPAGIGETFLEAGFLLQEDPPILRRPDVALVSATHWNATNLAEWFRGAPLIAVEVVSPSETASDLAAKIRQDLRFGSVTVWAVCPNLREVHQDRQDASIQALGAEDAITLPELPPGWSCTVDDLLP